MGHPVEYLDVGGGLATDYDGSRRSTFHSSMNYTVDEYARTSRLQHHRRRRRARVPHPDI
ncbi:MAG: hypothetical protein R3B70_43535 [Polyangiaceae bacterium]